MFLKMDQFSFSHILEIVKYFDMYQNFTNLMLKLPFSALKRKNGRLIKHAAFLCLFPLQQSKTVNILSF